ncbi:MAG: hypothetical protein AABY49_10935 [Planctomycetota bacterium]
MKIKTLRDIHSSLKTANFQRYYEDSKWLEKDIRTMREIDKESKSKSKGLVHDDQAINSRTPSGASSRH